MNSRVTIAGLALSAIATLSSAVRAAPETTPAPQDRIWVPDARPRKVPEVTDLRVNAGLGASAGKTLSGGVAGSLMTTYRYRFVEGGTTASVAACSATAAAPRRPWATSAAAPACLTS